MKDRLNRTNITLRNYTLVEMLVVIAIIAILIGLGAGGYTAARRWMSQSTTEALLAKLKISIESYKNDKGYYPLPHTPVGTSTANAPNFKLDTNAKDFDDIDDAKYDASDILPTGAHIGDIKYECIPRNNMNKFMDFGKIQDDQSLKVEGTLNRYYVKDGWNAPFDGISFPFGRESLIDDTIKYPGGPIKYRCPGLINRTSFDLYAAGHDRRFAADPVADMKDDIYAK